MPHGRGLRRARARREAPQEAARASACRGASGALAEAEAISRFRSIFGEALRGSRLGKVWIVNPFCLYIVGVYIYIYIYIQNTGIYSVFLGLRQIMGGG